MRLSPVRANHDEVVAFPQVQEWLSPLGACAGAGRGQEQYRQTADKANKCHSAAADARDGRVDGRKDPRVQPRHRPRSGHAPHRTKDYVRFRVRGYPAGNRRLVGSSGAPVPAFRRLPRAGDLGQGRAGYPATSSRWRPERPRRRRTWSCRRAADQHCHTLTVHQDSQPASTTHGTGTEGQRRPGHVT